MRYVCKAYVRVLAHMGPVMNQGTYTQKLAISFPRTHPKLLDKELNHITTLSHFCMILANQMATSVTRVDRKVQLLKINPTKRPKLLLYWVCFLFLKEVASRYYQMASYNLSNL